MWEELGKERAIKWGAIFGHESQQQEISFANPVDKTLLHCGREILPFRHHLRIAFKDLMMAGSTVQVIEVAYAFCHLGVISLSQSDT